LPVLAAGVHDELHVHDSPPLRRRADEARAVVFQAPGKKPTQMPAGGVDGPAESSPQQVALPSADGSQVATSASFTDPPSGRAKVTMISPGSVAKSGTSTHRPPHPARQVWCPVKNRRTSTVRRSPVTATTVTEQELEPMFSHAWLQPPPSRSAAFSGTQMYRVAQAFVITPPSSGGAEHTLSALRGF